MMKVADSGVNPSAATAAAYPAAMRVIGLLSGTSAEAMAFSLRGRNTPLGLPNHLSRCTGANRAAVLGEIAPGRDRRVRPR